MAYLYPVGIQISDRTCLCVCCYAYAGEDQCLSPLAVANDTAVESLALIIISISREWNLLYVSIFRLTRQQNAPAFRESPSTDICDAFDGYNFLIGKFLGPGIFISLSGKELRGTARKINR